MDESSWAVGWIGLALINACLAQIKNHLRGGKDLGGLAWFVISMFFGPLATALILWLKEPTQWDKDLQKACSPTQTEESAE